MEDVFDATIGDPQPLPVNPKAHHTCIFLLPSLGIRRIALSNAGAPEPDSRRAAELYKRGDDNASAILRTAVFAPM